MSTRLNTLNKRLLQLLGLSADSSAIVIEHIEELQSEAGKLRSEIICLKQDLADANLGRCTCTGCSKVVGNAWRDEDGHWCLSCLASQRDSARSCIGLRRGEPVEPAPFDPCAGCGPVCGNAACPKRMIVTCQQ